MPPKKPNCNVYIIVGLNTNVKTSRDQREFLALMRGRMLQRMALDDFLASQSLHGAILQRGGYTYHVIGDQLIKLCSEKPTCPIDSRTGRFTKKPQGIQQERKI